MTRLFVGAIVFVAILPVLASEPGQPLDCSDWVFSSPQYTCSTFLGPGSLPFPMPWLTGKASAMVTDNSGAIVFARFRYTAGFDGDSFRSLGRLEFVRIDGSGQHVVGYIEDRDLQGSLRDQIRPLTFFDNAINRGDGIAPMEPFVFDAVNGALLIPVHSYCSISCSYPDLHWIVAIRGFAPLLDVFQSYVPTNSSWGFTVPAMPEGVPAADHFDTYWGPLPGPIDFTQAQPLQCDYPTSPPHVGDYLTVNDPLPNPSAGHGYYYVTAATYQGQTRYGRKGTRGQLSGRDPVVLPTCVQPQP